MKNVITAEQLRCAPLLERMIEILGAPLKERASFDEALARAQRDTGIIAGESEGVLLVTAFKAIATGKLFKGALEA